MERNKYIVCVRCLTYNHSAFIEDAMNGFCMQQTNFPFVCVIVDDASSDGEQDIIHQYLYDNFEMDGSDTIQNKETNDYRLVIAKHKLNRNCCFVVFFLKYNHYSIKKPKRPYYEYWLNNIKYIAICEGDDYWIDSNKLQKQVDYLENHQNTTMICTRTKLYSNKLKKFVGENYCYNQSQIVEPKDIIRRTGGFISTCSILFCRGIDDNKPDYWLQCKVGDYPLQIMCAMRGRVFYFNDIMSVYRIDNPDSWMGRQIWGSFNRNTLEVTESLIKMFKGFMKDYPEYESVFKSKICDQILRNIPVCSCPKADIDRYLKYFSNEINKFSLKWRIGLKIRKLRSPILRVYFIRFFMGHYQARNIMY